LNEERIFAPRTLTPFALSRESSHEARMVLVVEGVLHDIDFILQLNEGKQQLVLSEDESFYLRVGKNCQKLILYKHLGLSQKTMFSLYSPSPLLSLHRTFPSVVKCHS
jgi:hypothetical protein